MKQTVICLTLLLLFIVGAQAQILSVVAGTDFNVVAGTELTTDSMGITPSINFNLNGSSIKHTTTSSVSTTFPYSGAVGVYQFSNSTNTFSGAIEMNNGNTEFNYIPTNYLSLNVFDGNGWNTKTVSSTSTLNRNLQATAITGVLLNQLAIATPAIWNGAVSTDWTLPANWVSNYTPKTTDNALVPSSLAKYPLISASSTAINGVTINNGGSLSVYSNSNLSFSGNVTNNGTIDASSGTITLMGATPQFFYSNTTTSQAKFKNLVLNNTAGMSLAAPISVTGTVTSQAGVLNAGGNLTLVSNANGTAVVDPVYGNITGNVTVQRYIPNTKLFYRDLGIIVNGCTMYNSWGSALPSGYSFFSYSPNNGGWSASLPQITPLVPMVGYRTLCNPNTTLSATGTLLIGNQSPVLASGVNTKSFIANPYASQVDFNALQTSGLYRTFWYYDPSISTTDLMWVSYSKTTGSSNTFSKVNQYLQPSQGFFVMNGLANTSLTFTEASKNNGNTQTAIFGTNVPLNKVSVGLFANGNNLDAAVVVFDKNFCTCFDLDDSPKFNNPGENLTFLVNGTDLCANAWDMPLSTDELPIHLYRLKVNAAYNLRIDASAYVANGLSAFLKDNVLNTQTLLVGDSIILPFKTATDTASYSHRYSIVFGKSVLPISHINLIATPLENKHVVLNWQPLDDKNAVSFTVQRSADAIHFSSLATVAAHSTSDYSYIDSTPNDGVNYYRIQQSDMTSAISYSNVVKLNTYYSPIATISVYPNPVTTGVFKLGFGNASTGRYNLQLVDKQGKIVFTNVLNHATVSNIETVIIGKQLSTGSYTVRLVDERGNLFYSQIIVQ